MSEISKIIDVYERRKSKSDVYNYIFPSNFLALHELEQTLVKHLNRAQKIELKKLHLLEVGCGNGNQLLSFLRMGFSPENLIGNDLILERVETARSKLPSTVKIYEGDALGLKLEDKKFDIIFQSLVFTSILDNEYKQKLANRLRGLLKEDGLLFWYDFVYDNPKNPDVKGIKLKNLKKLFPGMNIYCSRITLAPPISRLVTKLNPKLYNIFNFFPFLRTHILCSIREI